MKETFFNANVLTPALPFFRQEKMDILLKDLEYRHKKESKDFYRACGFRLRKPGSILQVYESQFSAWHNGCLHFREEHSHLAKELSAAQYSYLQLTALSSEKDFLEEIAKRNLAEQQRKSAATVATYWEQQRLLLPKEMEFLSLQKTKNHFLVNYEKSEDYKNLSLSKGAQAKQEYDIGRALQEQSKDDSFTVDLQVMRPDTAPPTYPEAPSYEPLEIPHTAQPQTDVSVTVQGTSAISQNPVVNFDPACKELQHPEFTQISPAYPDYLQGEVSLLKSMHIDGDNFARVYFPTEAPEEALVIHESTGQDCELPKTKTNILGSVGTSKLIISWLAVMAGTLTEYFIYTAVLGSIFGFEGVKYLVAGLVVLPLSKVIGFSLWGIVKRFIQQANTLSWHRLKSSRFFSFLITAALLYTLCLGVLYFDMLQHKSVVSEYILLQEQAQTEKEEQHWDIENTSAKYQQGETINNPKNEVRIQELEEKIFHPNTFITIIKGFTVGLSSSIILLINAVLLNIILLFSKAFFARRRIHKLSKLMTNRKKRFHAQRQSIHTLRLKAFSIFKIQGQIRFVRSIIHGGTPKDAVGGSLKSSASYENAIILPSSNGKSKEPLKL